MEHDLFVVNSLQSVQIFDTVLLPCYLPRVSDVRTNPIVGNLVHWFRTLVDDGRSSGACAYPDRRPRLEQVPSVLISKISGEEIANTKTIALPVNRARKTW